MTDYIQFFGTKGDVVTVNYETGEDIEKIATFEARRIKSLQDRNIPIISETRTWDSKREISVRWNTLSNMGKGEKLQS